jgi:opacity protein-like surface antigen
MKIIIFFISLLSFVCLHAQNKRFIATTSIGGLTAFKNTQGISNLGFTTVTGIEFSVSKNFKLIGSLDFQSIGYLQTNKDWEINQNISLIPVLLGGRWLFTNKSAWTPYVSAGAGITILSLPKGEIMANKTFISTANSRPFTYAFRPGLQYSIKETFFPFIELGYQSTAMKIADKNLNLSSFNVGVRTFLF